VDLDGGSPDWGRVDAKARRSIVDNGFPDVGA
jgi:hypothetical protein